MSSPFFHPFSSFSILFHPFPPLPISSTGHHARFFSQRYDTHYTERYLNDPKVNAVGYKQSTVFAYLDGLRSPLLLLHGMADNNVLFTNSTRLISDLTSRSVLFDLMAYPGAKHGLATKKNKIHRDRTIEAFFAKHLGNGTRQSLDVSAANE